LRPGLCRDGQPDPAGRRCAPARVLHPGPGGWATDPGELAAAIGPQTAAVLLMSPVMPTGAVLSAAHLEAIAGPVNRHGAWVIWDAAMDRIRFDSQPRVHPGAHSALAGRTSTVGSASKELRMIGWRVGWVTCWEPLAGAGHPGAAGAHRAAGSPRAVPVHPQSHVPEGAGGPAGAHQRLG
jgi:aspartate/methionine/tyrosine aminotransferase